MEGKDEMRPIIFKGGKEFGKVEGIKGLYRDPSGRWFVRYSRSGVDRQKSIQVNGNPNFSGLERAADSALRKLKKEVMDELNTHTDTQTPTPEQDTFETALKRGCAQMEKFITSTYSLATGEANVKRRVIQLEGFCLITKNTKAKYIDDLNNHNINKLNQMLNEFEGKQKAFEYYKGIKAVFTKAIKAGVHLGQNPAYLVSKPIDNTKKDYGYLTIKQMSNILYTIKNDNNNIVTLSKQERKELCIFCYLLSIGMRATSAILFKGEDVEAVKDGDNTKYYYTVINHKLKIIMPYKQMLSNYIVKEFDLMSFSGFTMNLDKLTDSLNLYCHSVDDSGLTLKHFRKGFINSCCGELGFDIHDVERLTHIPTSTIEKSYYSQAQPICDNIMTSFNNNFLVEFLFAEEG